jgi:hypothetical protein
LYEFAKEACGEGKDYFYCGRETENGPIVKQEPAWRYHLDIKLTEEEYNSLFKEE